jgi:hypothetical protein
MLELSLLDSSWFKLAYDGLEREFKFFNQLEGDGMHREIKEDPATANMSGSNCSRCGVGGGPMLREERDLVRRAVKLRRSAAEVQGTK